MTVLSEFTGLASDEDVVVDWSTPFFDRMVREWRNRDLAEDRLRHAMQIDSRITTSLAVMEVKETVQRTVTVRLVAPPAPMDNAGEQTQTDMKAIIVDEPAPDLVQHGTTMGSFYYEPPRWQQTSSLLDSFWDAADELSAWGRVKATLCQWGRRLRGGR